MFSLDPAQFDNRSKKVSADWCEEMLEKYDRDASKDVYEIVTDDKSWIYEQQSTVCVLKDELKPTKIVRGSSTSKQMVACFFGKTDHVVTIPIEHSWDGQF